MSNQEHVASVTPDKINPWDVNKTPTIDEPIVKPQSPIKYDMNENYDDYMDLDIDNDDKEFIFNPNLTDEEFSKLSFDDRTQWQLMNAQYKG